MSRRPPVDWTMLRIELDDRSRGLCEGCGQHRGTDGVVHHRKLRSQGGQDDPVNLAVLHDGCHKFAHANPAWAMAHGWIVSGWADPAEAPLLQCAPVAVVCWHLDPGF